MRFGPKVGKGGSAMVRALNSERQKTMAAKKKTTKAKPERAPRNLAIANALNALRQLNPVEWRQKVLDAFRAHDGNAVHAATALGIGHRTILRYLDEDKAIAAAVDKMRETAREDRASEKDEATA